MDGFVSLLCSLSLSLCGVCVCHGGGGSGGRCFEEEGEEKVLLGKC